MLCYTDGLVEMRHESRQQDMPWQVANCRKTASVNGTSLDILPLPGNEVYGAHHCICRVRPLLARDTNGASGAGQVDGYLR